MSELFKFPHGFVDSTGAIHVDFEVEEMTGATEEAMAKKDVRANTPKIIRTILENCITRIGSFVKDDMSAGEWRDIITHLIEYDQDFAMMQIRMMTIGDEFVVNHKCPNEECEQRDLKTTISVEKDLELIPFNGTEPIPFELPKGILKNGVLLKKGTMRFPIGEDREILNSVMKNNLGAGNTMLLARIVTMDGGVKLTDSDVRTASYADRKAMVNALVDNKFGYSAKISITCPKCETEFTGMFNPENFL